MKKAKSSMVWKAWLSSCAALLLILFTGVKVMGYTDTVWTYNFPARIWAYNASCANNLKQMGLVIRMFFNESQGGAYPELSSEDGKLMFIGDEVYPNYLYDTQVMVCPGVFRELPEDLFDDGYYVYTGHLLLDDEDVLNFADYYTAQIAAGGDFSAYEYPEGGDYFGDETVLRLREGVERFQITDINDPGGLYVVQSNIPIMWDWPSNHQSEWGGNVLYMDGHVEWQAYPGEFPMTETCINTLAALANYTPPTAWAGFQPYVPFYSLEEDPTFYKNRYYYACYSDMRYLFWDFKYFSNESSGEVFPVLSSESGRLMFAEEELFPEYTQYENRLLCQGPAEQSPESLFDDQHYMYLSHMLLTDEDVLSFASAYPGIIGAGGDFSGDITAEASYGAYEDTLFRLRDGVQRFLITDVNTPVPALNLFESTVPVMIEWPDNHIDRSGGHVTFMDGHVEWMEYPGEFPMTETTITTLAALAGHAPVTEWRGDEPSGMNAPDPYGYSNACSSNQRQLSLIAQMYTNESQGLFFPPYHSESGRLMFSDSLMPEYLSDTDVFTCPGTTLDPDVNVFDDRHYVYLGYAVTDDDDVLSFVDAYEAEVLAGGDFSGHLDAPSSYGAQLMRLSYPLSFDGSYQKYLVTDNPDPYEQIVSKDEIPILIEWPDHHEGATGGHVTYMDGHSEWIDYPGKFPMTETTINALADLAGYIPNTTYANKGYNLANDPQLRALCELNMKHFGLALKTYASMSPENLYPDLSEQDGQLMMTDSRYFRYHFFDLERLNCPGSPLAFQPPSIDDHSYGYLGYMVRDEAELSRFADAYAQQIIAGGDFTEDLLEGDSTIFRLKEGIERFLITDINNPNPAAFSQSEIPVKFEWPDNHDNIRGGNVLYMDGHVEWLDYPGEFPMTVAAMDILTELAGRSPILPILDPDLKAKAKLIFQSFKELNDEHDQRLDLAESGLSEFEFNQLDLDGDDFLSIPELLQTAVGPRGQRKPVYVDFNNTDAESGSPTEPFDSLLKGANFVAARGRVCINPGDSSEELIISGAMILELNGDSGVVRIGVSDTP